MKKLHTPQKIALAFLALAWVFCMLMIISAPNKWSDFQIGQIIVIGPLGFLAVYWYMRRQNE